MTPERRITIKQYIQIIGIFGTLTVSYLNNRQNDDIKFEVLKIQNSIQTNVQHLDRIDKTIIEKSQEGKEVHKQLFGEIDKLRDGLYKIRSKNDQAN